MPDNVGTLSPIQQAERSVKRTRMLSGAVTFAGAAMCLVPTGLALVASGGIPMIAAAAGAAVGMGLWAIGEYLYCRKAGGIIPKQKEKQQNGVFTHETGLQSFFRRKVFTAEHMSWVNTALAVGGLVMGALALAGVLAIPGVNVAVAIAMVACAALSLVMHFAVLPAVEHQIRSRQEKMLRNENRSDYSYDGVTLGPSLIAGVTRVFSANPKEPTKGNHHGVSANQQRTGHTPQSRSNT